MNLSRPSFCLAILLAFSLAACSSPEEKAARYLASGEQLFESGQLGKAELEYRNALQINQNLPEALYGLARIFEHRKQWQKEYAMLARMRELAPRHIEGRIMLARLLLASNQLDEALLDAREIIELAPQDARAHALLAAVLAVLDNHESALREAEKSLEIAPGNSDAILVQARVHLDRREFETALRALREAINIDPGNISYYLLQLQAYEALGDSDAMEGVYLELIERDPQNSTFKNALARHFILEKNLDAAEQVLAQAAGSGPGNVPEKLRLVAFLYQYRSTAAAIGLVRTYIGEDANEYAYRFLLGELYQRGGESAQAANVYRNIIENKKLQQHGLEARNQLAKIALRKGNYDEATGLIDVVLEHDAANANALLLKAETQFDRQHYEDALINIRQVLRDDPDSTRALELLGRTYAGMGSQDLAIDSLRKVLKLNPGSVPVAYHLAKLYFDQGKLAQADEILLASISRGNRSLEAIKLLARVKLGLGQWDEAELLLQELKDIDRLEAQSQQALGFLYQATDNQVASIAAFRRAHEIAPTSARPMAALVTAYVRNGQAREARRFLENVIEIDAENATAQLLLARLRRDRNDLDGAIAGYRRTLAIDPGASRAWHELAEIYLAKKDPREAERIVLQGLAALPDNPLLVVDLASLQVMQGNVDRAIATYEASLGRKPGLLVIRNNLASLLSDLDDTAAVERALEIAKPLEQSQLAQFRDTWAWASIRANTNLEAAVQTLAAIVSENGQFPVYHYHLGDAYRLLGKTASAKSHLRQALKLADPGSPLADQASLALQRLE